MAKSKSTILVKDIMVKNVVSVMPETSILEAAEKMIKNTFTGMPVVDKNKRPVGMLDIQDVLRAGLV